MNRVLAPRASSILYDILCSQEDRLPFLLPANICPIVPITFLKADVPFEFVDISPRSLHMDTDLAEQRLRSGVGKYGGILYAHTYGDPTTPADFLRWVKDRWSSLLVIDDRCLCVPELEEPEGSMADVVLYSTGYAKIVDLGFGGYAFLGDEVAHGHRHLGFEENELKALEAGYRACIDAGLRYVYRDSAWLLTDAVLPAWDKFAQRVREGLQRTLPHRREVNAVYNAVVPARFQLADEFQLWRFNIRLSNKDAALKAVFDAGLFASSHYRSLAGIMGEGTGAHARDLAAHVINLFNDQHYTIDMAERTARLILRNL